MDKILHFYLLTMSSRY